MIANVIRVVVADDNQLFRQTLRSVLQKQPRIEVIAEAENGQSAVDVVVAHRPDAVFMDINMPLMDGIEATRLITTRVPGIKVIVLTVHDAGDYSDRAYAAGAFNFISKTSSRNEILKALYATRPV